MRGSYFKAFSEEIEHFPGSWKWNTMPIASIDALRPHWEKGLTCAIATEENELLREAPLQDLSNRKRPRQWFSFANSWARE